MEKNVDGSCNKVVGGRVYRLHRWMDAGRIALLRRAFLLLTRILVLRVMKVGAFVCCVGEWLRSPWDYKEEEGAGIYIPGIRRHVVPVCSSLFLRGKLVVLDRGIIVDTYERTSLLGVSFPEGRERRRPGCVYVEVLVTRVSCCCGWGDLARDLMTSIMCAFPYSCTLFSCEWCNTSSSGGVV